MRRITVVLVAVLFLVGACSTSSSSDGVTTTAAGSTASIDPGELQQWLGANYDTTEWEPKITEIDGNGPVGVVVIGDFNGDMALEACKATLEFAEENGVINAQIEVTDASGQTTLASSTADKCED